MNFIERIKLLRFRIFYRLMLRSNVPLVRLGGDCQWSLSDRDLGRGSRVLCAGAGGDISFEVALIRGYGCKVVLLDPSPTGIATVERAGLPPEQLDFRPIGLAGSDGVLGFEPPLVAEEGSFRESQGSAPAALQFRCSSLRTLIADLDWTCIDLLKMDIEGSEYAVLEDILKNGIDVRQICTEFHYDRGFNHRRGDMIRAILSLRRAGYRLVHHVHSDHTFLRSGR